jgi:hypothetical protein
MTLTHVSYKFLNCAKKTQNYYFISPRVNETLGFRVHLLMHDV